MKNKIFYFNSYNIQTIIKIYKCSYMETFRFFDKDTVHLSKYLVALLLQCVVNNTSQVYLKSNQLVVSYYEMTES